MGKEYVVEDVRIRIDYDRVDVHWRGKRYAYIVFIERNDVAFSFSYYGENKNYIKSKYHPDLLEDVLQFITYLYFDSDRHYAVLKDIVTKDWVDNLKVYLKLSKT